MSARAPSPAARHAALARVLVAGLVLAAGCGHDDAANAAVDAGTSSPAPRCAGFVDVGAEEAIDLSTGLRWDTYAELTRLTHDEAEARCKARGKRLPKRDELLALRTASADGCGLPACPFRGDRCATIQCGSLMPGTTSHWGVAFSGGTLVAVPAGQAEAVLCVADP